MKPGDVAPDFELPDETGATRSLSGLLAAGPIVLFFYPAAMTSGCTAESCHFRDLAEEFAAVGAQRVGISADPISRQREFTAKHTFGFPLLSDTEGTVAEQFGVRRVIKALPVKRHTFVVGTDRRIIEVVKSEVRMTVHADRALAALRSHVGT